MYTMIRVAFEIIKNKKSSNDVVWVSPIRINPKDIDCPKWHNDITEFEVKTIPEWTDKIEQVKIKRSYGGYFYQDKKVNNIICYTSDEKYEAIVTEYGIVLTRCLCEDIINSIEPYIVPEYFKDIPVIGVTGYFFYGFKTKEVIFPDTVYGIASELSLSEKPIENCWNGNIRMSSLKAVRLGKNFHLHNNVFKDCTSLEHIYGINENIKKIGKNAFDNCVSLDMELSFPNLIYVGDNAFRKCGKLKLHNLDTSKIGYKAMLNIPNFYSSSTSSKNNLDLDSIDDGYYPVDNIVNSIIKKYVSLALEEDCL